MRSILWVQHNSRSVKRIKCNLLSITNLKTILFPESFDLQEICELQEVILFPFRPLHMVLPLGSPLKELFRVSVRRLMETGVAQYYTNKFYAQRPRCVIDGPFWMLAWTAGVAFALLVVENVVHRVRMFLETRRVLRHYPVWLE